jgi:hypothetical protein
MRLLPPALLTFDTHLLAHTLTSLLPPTPLPRHGTVGFLSLLLCVARQWGKTALMYAASRGDSDSVKLLLGHGADPSLRDLVLSPSLRSSAYHFSGQSNKDARDYARTAGKNLQEILPNLLDVCPLLLCLSVSVLMSSVCGDGVGTAAAFSICDRKENKDLRLPSGKSSLPRLYSYVSTVEESLYPPRPAPLSFLWRCLAEATKSSFLC